MSAHPAGRRQRLLSIAAVAKDLDVSEKTVRRWIEGRLLAAHQLGRQWRVSDEDLQAFLAATDAHDLVTGGLEHLGHQLPVVVVILYQEHLDHRGEL